MREREKREREKGTRREERRERERREREREKRKQILVTLAHNKDHRKELESETVE